MKKIIGLDWHTDLESAKHVAQKTSRPILSLRLLGRLDEAYSCANSRYFRALLYPEPRVREAMSGFVLHWQSLRPVPKVTIDFGDGRTLVRTITGNSLHAVLRADGTPVDAILGLLSVDAFVNALSRALPMTRATTSELAERHRDALADPPALPPAKIEPERVMDASRVAMTKHMVESPILQQLRALEKNIAHDTRTNELDLHARLHRHFADGARFADAGAMVDWIYEHLFLMPPSDPFMGLDAPDAFSALPSART
ncbi:MAG TPA: hypothetical protein VH054_00230 [Polyangiaceae bacterium]|jgi:hypothetical protein|nr:hypothetical protein [Polyangiaceae bacterium]